jgi:hypothetical protein
VRVNGDRRLRDQVFDGGEFRNVVVTDWRYLTVNGEPEYRRLREELQFLVGLGLATVIPGTALAADGAGEYALSPRIDELYADDGVFVNVNDERERKSQNFINLLVRYVLPGMFWRNYYVTHGLASDLHLTLHLGEEMLEIGNLWDHLAGNYGFRFSAT